MGRAAISRLFVGFALASVAGCAVPGGPSGAPAETTSSTAPPEYESTYDLVVGDCFDPILAADDGEMLAAQMRPCDEPHLAEAFAIDDLEPPPSAKWPGEAAVNRMSEELCEPAFEDYVGIRYDDSTLDVFWYVPLEEAWASGDREVLCTVQGDQTAPLITSVRGSKG